VTADQGGVLENMRDGINGMVVPTGAGERFAEAIVTLIRDLGQRDAMGQAARAFAVGRDWNREIAELERMYADAIARASVSLGRAGIPAPTVAREEPL